MLDADEFARLAVARGSEGLKQVVSAFGKQVLTADGDLDRKAVAAIVFSDEAKRQQLNAIVHPRVGELMMNAAEELRRNGEAVACYEAALLVESGRYDGFRPLVVVSAPKELQVARIMARDGATKEEAERRIAAQILPEKRLSAADFVIENTGSIDDLLRETDRVLQQVLERFGSS